MNFIKNDILAASKTIDIKVREISFLDANSIRAKIEQLYSSQKSSSPLWERLSDSSSLYDPNGWKRIQEYTYKDEIILFFDLDNEKNMYAIDDIKNLVLLLAECSGFVFYITNEGGDFLLCHNDHDYLIGAGDSKKWLAAQSTN